MKRVRLLSVLFLALGLLGGGTLLQRDSASASYSGDADTDPTLPFGGAACAVTMHYSWAPNFGRESYDEAVRAAGRTLVGLTARTVATGVKAYERVLLGQRVEAFQVMKNGNFHFVAYRLIQVPCTTEDGSGGGGGLVGEAIDYLDRTIKEVNGNVN